MQSLGYLKELMKGPVPKEMAFWVVEYQERVANVRVEMDRVYCSPRIQTGGSRIE